MNKALVLLNMGGARNKEELKVFLTNMFNDKNILTIQ
jgi:ferrochelatase